MEPTFFVGVDISKQTLDVAVLKDGALMLTRQVENSESGMCQLLEGLRTAHRSTKANTLFCAENMGIYCKFLREGLHHKKFQFCLDSPLRIRLSMGLQRGKSDTLDAIRIAEYAWRNHDTLKLWEPPRECVQRLKELSTIRRKLVKMQSMLKSTKTVESYFLKKATREKIASYSRGSLTAIKSDILLIEKEMDAIVKADENLRRLSTIITSVPCVGVVAAREIITATNEFRDISNPKSFACYCGIAPFGKSSGATINLKPRISPVANKGIKTILHLAAMFATRTGESVFHSYYRRKVREGKNKMSVLNAIRNKIVRIIFACVRDNQLYQDPAESIQQPVSGRKASSISRSNT